jgi:hypothetical protein
MTEAQTVDPRQDEAHAQTQPQQSERPQGHEVQETHDEVEPGERREPNEPTQPDSRGQWRDRAKLAEREIRELKQELEAVGADLREARESLEASERRQRIERELAREEALDVEALTLLTQAALASGDASDGDIKSAVSELKRRKPHLFGVGERQPALGAFRAGAMSPADDRGLNTALETARREAGGTGDRRDLLRYLRLKRSA